MKNIRQYQIAVEIARHGSISKAARSMNISQSTLSKLLQKLEEEQGMELFDRTSIPMKPTPAGKCFVEMGQRILDLDYQLEKQLDNIRTNGDGIRLGISPSRAPFILPGLVSSYTGHYPGNKITVREGSTAQLNAALAGGDVDFIISLKNDSTKKFRNVLLFKETTLLAVPRSMADLSAEEILRTQPFISLCSGTRLYALMRRIMNKLNRPAPSIECQSIETAISLVQAGLGAMIVPSYLAEQDHYGSGGIGYLRLPEEYYAYYSDEFHREVCLFYRGEEFLSEKELAFLELCRKEYGTEGTPE